MRAALPLLLFAAPLAAQDLAGSYVVKEMHREGKAVPDDVRKIRAGHALSRLWLARHNTRLSGDRAAETSAASKWTAPLSSFGKAGVALGLQDK